MINTIIIAIAQKAFAYLSSDFFSLSLFQNTILLKPNMINQKSNNYKLTVIEIPDRRVAA